MSEMIELAESHTYHPNPQTSLSISLKNGNFEEFQHILTTNFGGSIDINHLYGDPDNKSLLEIACSCKNRAKFVELLLQYGADVNLNRLQGRAPIHLAVLHSDYDTLKLLVENNDIDVDKRDTSGHTALTLASQRGNDDFVRLLRKHLATDMKRIEKRSQSSTKIDMRDEEHEPLVQSTNYPNQANFLVTDPDLSLQNKGKPSKENLLSSLLARNYEAFASEATKTNIHHDKNARRLTYLQYACKFGLTAFVRLLLDLRVNPNETSLRSRNPPIMIAAYNGHYDIVKMLVDTPKITYSLVDGDNLFHIMFIGAMTRDGRCAESDSTHKTFGDQNQDFYKCLRYLLDTISNTQVDVNLFNRRDKTVLHYAVIADNRDVIRLLVEKGAYIGATNSRAEMPVKFMKAATLEYLLDMAIITKRHTLMKNHRIIIDYNLLVCKHLDPLTAKETSPLIAISQVSQLRPLLKHPFFTAFLDLKWYFIMNKLMLINYILYTLYVLSLSSYLLIAYAPITAKMTVQNHSTVGWENNTIAFQNTTVPNITEHKLQEIDVIIWYVVAILNCILFFREFLQFVIYSNPNKYRYIKNPENWIEVALISIVYVILFSQTDNAETRSLLAVTAIFLSWIDLMLLILSHPITSVHLSMFKAVAWNSFKFLLCYSMLILAFALSFYMLFKDTSLEFKDIVLAIFKTGVMSTGEYEISNNPFDREFGIRHLIFVLFVFLVPIVLLNLLNGVAISDIQGIRNNAELVSTVARVKFIVHMEEMISDLLSFVDKLAFHYNTLVRRYSNSEANEYCSKLKHQYRQNINLFSTLSEDGKVFITPNQNNAVFIRSCQLGAGPQDKLNTNGRLPKLFISASAMETINERLSHRASNWEKASRCENILEASRAVPNSQEIYKSHLLQLQNASARTEDRLEIIEQKLAEITALLKEKL